VRWRCIDLRRIIKERFDERPAVPALELSLKSRIARRYVDKFLLVNPFSQILLHL
jgi:hypothetical protein